jgi:hypothetical protein
VRSRFEEQSSGFSVVGLGLKHRHVVLLYRWLSRDGLGLMEIRRWRTDSDLMIRDGGHDSSDLLRQRAVIKVGVVIRVAINKGGACTAYSADLEGLASGYQDYAVEEYRDETT